MARRQDQLALVPVKKVIKKIKLLAKILALMFQKKNFFSRKNNYLIDLVWRKKQ